MSIERFPTPLPVPFSKAVKAGGFLFLSGVLAMDANAKIIDADIGGQTRVILERVAATLAECGATMADVVRVTVWLSDFADFAEFNREYERHFGRALPARSTVRADLYQGAKVEIEVQALAGASPAQ
ncbi:MAG: RidA family protein [Gammaproteobacteria bacterium]|nr:RidA family protein [Gammaproteobacteria bacterium]MBU1440478.1 RidA family protein [Gammaproteobacteria bacterium]MBU2284838.1 RidA family protein [Gammaproteobacteria bacterium]MBU2409892.1 RidA family protein [Gammaproteobacteria bacterium]